MKTIVMILMAFSILWLGSCGGSSGGDGFSCDDSELSVNIQSQTDADCSIGGSFIAAATGNNGSVQFRLDAGVYQNSATFSNLSAGTYTVTVKDSKNCTASTQVVIAGEDGVVVIEDFATEDSGCKTSNGQITVFADGGTGELQYRLNSGSFQISNIFTEVQAGNHTVTVTDEEDCSATRNVRVLTGIQLVTQIMPILSANCATNSSGSGCHNGTGTAGSSRNWLSKSQVISNATSINNAVQSGFMPQAGSGRSLTQDEKDLIFCWVNDGAPDN
jgi:hypothetical protein